MDPSSTPDKAHAPNQEFIQLAQPRDRDLAVPERLSVCCIECTIGNARIGVLMAEGFLAEIKAQRPGSVPDEISAELYLVLGKGHERLSEFNYAERAWDKGIRVCTPIPELDSPLFTLRYKLLVAQAQLALKLENSDACLEFTAQGLEELERSGPLSCSAHAQLLSLRGRAYEQAGQALQAIDALWRAQDHASLRAPTTRRLEDLRALTSLQLATDQPLAAAATLGTTVTVAQSLGLPATEIIKLKTQRGLLYASDLQLDEAGREGATALQLAASAKTRCPELKVEPLTLVAIDRASHGRTIDATLLLSRLRNLNLAAEVTWGVAQQIVKQVIIAAQQRGNNHIQRAMDALTRGFAA